MDEHFAVEFVMPGLVAGIHVSATTKSDEDVDGRHKAGHDEVGEPPWATYRPATFCLP